MTKPGVVRVDVHEATMLSQLLRLVERNQAVEISRGGDLVARITPIRSTEKRRLGTDEGAIVVPDDFDAPLPEDVQAGFSE